MCCPATSKKSHCGVILWKGRGGGGRQTSRVKAFHDGLPVELEAEKGAGGEDVLRVAVDDAWLDLAVQAVGAVQVADSICGEGGREKI